MKNPLLKKPLWLNIIVLIVSGVIGSFTSIFGFAHLIEGIKQGFEGSNPNIPAGEQILGGIIVTSLCLIGVASVVVAVASIKGLLNRERG